MPVSRTSERSLKESPSDKTKKAVATNSEKGRPNSPVLDKATKKDIKAVSSIPTKEKLKKDGKEIGRPIVISTKEIKRSRRGANVRESTSIIKRSDREYRRFRTKFNSSMSNIVRDWMSVVYCILLLRMNLLNFILRKMPDYNANHYNFSNQILFENQSVYKMIKEAQVYTQDHFLQMWSEIEKLITSRAVLKKALESVQMKECGAQRDWKAAGEKLIHLQQELKTAQSIYSSIEESRTNLENNIQTTCLKLENLGMTKDAEYEQLLKDITELKKKEVQMRGKILLNMKNYKDLKTKKQSLLSVENEMNQLKLDQNKLEKKYLAKIHLLKQKIDEKERQIQAEREKSKIFRSNLEKVGDFVEQKSGNAINIL